MPAPADSSGYPYAGYPKTGSPESGSPGPESTPRPLDSGPDSAPPDYATLSPYLRRRLRSLSEALSDIAESRWGTADRLVATRPGSGAAIDPEARRQAPPRLG